MPNPQSAYMRARGSAKSGMCEEKTARDRVLDANDFQMSTQEKLSTSSKQIG
jgi:hypothetical protein